MNGNKDNSTTTMPDRATGTKPIVVIVGPPGSGKGTVCKALVEGHGFCHIAPGDTLRKHIELGTEVGRLAKGLIDEGRFVPDEVSTGLALDELRASVAENPLGPVIFDGYPRNKAQCILFDEALAGMGLSIGLLIVMDASDELVRSRLCGRRVHVPSGRVYNVDTSPPREEGRDDETGEPLVQRPDDSEERVSRRLMTYHEVTSPVIDHYEAVYNQYQAERIKARVPIVFIDASKTIEQIRRSVVGTLRDAARVIV